MLRLADSYLRAGLKEKAKDILTILVEKYPTAKAVGEAKEKLNGL